MNCECDQLGPYSDVIAGERDVPLSFRWRSDATAIAHLGLAPAQNTRYADTRNALLSEVALAAEMNRSVSYSRRKNYYTHRSRYHGSSVSYRTVLAAVSDALRAGLLTEDRARPGSRGCQSRLHATTALRDTLREQQCLHPPHEVLWLRNQHGVVDYIDTPLTRKMRREIEVINEVMSAIEIDFKLSGRSQN